MTMTKFRDGGDIGYDRISKRLKRWVAQAQEIDGTKSA